MKDNAGPVRTGDFTTIGLNSEDLTNFIGNGSEVYLPQWEGGESQAVRGWNWAAFLANIFWLGYRKMYVWALAGAFIYILLDLLISDVKISVAAGIIIAIALGFFGNTLYFRHAQNKIAYIKQIHSEPAVQQHEIARAGGTSFLSVLVIAVLLSAYAAVSILVFPDDRSLSGKKDVSEFIKTDKQASPTIKTSEPESGQQKKTPAAAPFAQADFDSLFNGWVLLDKTFFNIDDKAFMAIGMGRVMNDQAQVRLAVCEYDGKWKQTWRIPRDMETQCMGNSEFRKNPAAYLHALAVLEDSSSALVTANVLVGGAHGTCQVMAFVVDKQGQGSVKMFDSAGIMSVKKQEKEIVVEGEGEFSIHKLSLQKGSYHDEIVPLSSAGSTASDVKAYFIIGGYDETVSAAQAENLTARVGQTIAFIPADDKTRQIFDRGQIQIYSDAWNGPPLTLCEANRIKTGNSYTFDKPGRVEFVLLNTSDTYSTQNPPPTFTVSVE